MTTATKPGTNGIHDRNGHASASRPANDAPPLDAVSTVGGPKPAAEKPPADGRSAKGTFAPGNTFARGNPNARKMAALRAALLASMTAERMKALGEHLYAAAMAGNCIAAKLLLAYAIGKPADGPDPDRLDLDEWKLLDASPTKPQVLRAKVDSCAPAEAAAFIHAGLALHGEFSSRILETSGEQAKRVAVEMRARAGK
jgi:hypothetical protein